MKRTLLRDIAIASLLAAVGLLFTVRALPAPAQVPLEGWIGMGLATFVFYLWADHFAHCAWDYLDRRGPRRLRALMIAFLLAAGALGILMGVVARYVPAFTDPARFIRWVTLGMLLVGGIVTWVTWRWEGPDDGR